MDLKELVIQNRSYRRFDQTHAISKDELRDLVELARFCGSGANRQALRFICSSAEEMNRQIFETLGWATYFPEWPGPAESERPTGYIVILCDPGEWKWMMADLGIAAQSILLGAVEIGLGGCMIGNIKKKGLQAILDIPEGLEPVLVIAIGKPVEQIVIEDIPTSQSIKYYRSEDGVHHVPKIVLDDLITRVYE